MKLKKKSLWLGIEGEGEDNSFQINTVILDGNGNSITKEDIQTDTAADVILNAFLDMVRAGKISKYIRKTPYAKIFKELLVVDNI